MNGICIPNFSCLRTILWRWKFCRQFQKPILAILKFRSPLLLIHPIEMWFSKVLWGVYPEVSMVLAQNNWENSILLNHIGESLRIEDSCLKMWFLRLFSETVWQNWDSSNELCKIGIFKTEIKHGFWYFSPKTVQRNWVFPTVSS